MIVLAAAGLIGCGSLLTSPAAQAQQTDQPTTGEIVIAEDTSRLVTATPSGPRAIDITAAPSTLIRIHGAGQKTRTVRTDRDGHATVKKLTATEKPATIVFYFALTGLIFSSVPAILAWQSPTPGQLFQLLLLGTAAATAQYIMTRAYSFAPASKISHYAYSSVLYASLFGWLVWDEWMDHWAWFGAVLVMFSGILLLRRRRV